jgi:hypothetical protein
MRFRLHIAFISLITFLVPASTAFSEQTPLLKYIEEYARLLKPVAATNELFFCLGIFHLDNPDLADSDRGIPSVWETYNRTATKASVQVEKYISSHADNPSKLISLEAHRLLIWQRITRDSDGQTRSPDELNVAKCVDLVRKLQD